MRCAILVAARLGSTRLARKPLLDVAGEPAVALLLRRILHGVGPAEDEKLRVAVAAADEPESRALAHAVPDGVPVLYGPARNIPARELAAARTLDAQAVVNVDGDDLFCSVAAMDRVRAALEHGAPYARTTGLPLGMNVLGFSCRYLEERLAGRAGEVIETGWTRVFDEAACMQVPMSQAEPDPQLRLTLDYAEDLRFFRALASALGARRYEATDDEVLGCVAREGLANLNAGRARQYWREFRAAQAAEEKSR